MIKEEFIEKIKATKFLCVDAPETEEELKDEEYYKTNLIEFPEQMLAKYKTAFDRNSEWINTEASLEAIQSYYDDLTNYDKFHLASHFSILGRVVKDVMDDKVREITLESFDHTTKCAVNKLEVKALRDFLLTVIV